MTVPYIPPEVTPIPPQQESAFRAWVKKHKITDLDAPDSYYDYRGAFLAGLNPDSKSGHWPDTFKQHGHPTFSVESQYSKGLSDGGSWNGETFIPQAPPMATPSLADILTALGKHPQGDAILNHIIGMLRP